MKEKIDVDETMGFLVKKEGYSRKAASGAAAKLARSDEVLQVAYRKWRETGEIENDLTVEGFSWGQLVSEYDMKPVGALLTLDWLLREPDMARKMLKRGYDLIRFDAGE